MLLSKKKYCNIGLNVVNVIEKKMQSHSKMERKIYEGVQEARGHCI